MKKTNKRTLTPKLRFPEFRDKPGWEEKPLDAVCSPVERKTRKPANHYTGLGVRSHGKGTFLKPNEDPAKNSMEYLYEVNENDLILNITFAWEGAIAIAQSIDGGALVSHRFPTYVFNRDVALPEFFHYRIHNKQFIYDLGVISPGGAGRNRVLNRTDFLKLNLPIPELNEQQKIADCLSSLDELIAAEGQKREALRAHKKGLMQQLFPRPGETRPRLRFPEFHNAPEWEPKTLVDACRMKAGKFVAAAEIKEQNAVDLFPCYGGNGLRGFTATYTHDGVYPLIGRQGALCGNAKLATGRFHATEHAVVSTPNQGVDVVWLYYLLDLLNLNRFATGQAQPGLSVDVLEKVPVTIPKDETEQQRIASCLSSLDTQITTEIQKIDAFMTHKNGLMQQLFPSPEE